MTHLIVDPYPNVVTPLYQAPPDDPPPGGTKLQNRYLCAARGSKVGVKSLHNLRVDKERGCQNWTKFGGQNDFLRKGCQNHGTYVYTSRERVTSPGSSHAHHDCLNIIALPMPHMNAHHDCRPMPHYLPHMPNIIWLPIHALTCFYTHDLKLLPYPCPTLLSTQAQCVCPHDCPSWWPTPDPLLPTMIVYPCLWLLIHA